MMNFHSGFRAFLIERPPADVHIGGRASPQR
jgi:hypothetical protein